MDYTESPWFEEEVKCLAREIEIAGVEVSFLEPEKGRYYVSGAPELWFYVATFVIGGIANGLFGAIGQQAYDAIKNRICKIARRAREEHSSVDVRINIQSDSRSISIKILRIEEGNPSQLEVLVKSASHVYVDLSRRIGRLGSEKGTLEVYAEVSLFSDQWQGWILRNEDGSRTYLEEVKEPI